MCMIMTRRGWQPLVPPVQMMIWRKVIWNFIDKKWDEVAPDSPNGAWRCIGYTNELGPQPPVIVNPPVISMATRVWIKRIREEINEMRARSPTYRPPLEWAD